MQIYIKNAHNKVSTQKSKLYKKAKKHYTNLQNVLQPFIAYPL